MTLQGKYLLVVNAFLLVVLSAFFYLDIRLTEQLMTAQARESLEEVGATIQSLLLASPLPDLPSIQEAMSTFHALHPDMEVLILDPRCRVLASTSPSYRGRTWEEEQIWEVLRGRLPLSHRVMSHHGLKVLDLTLPLRREGRIVGAIHISKALESINAGLRQMKKGHLLHITLNLLLLSFIVNFITHRLIIRRLQYLAGKMEKVGRGETDIEASPPGKLDEIGRLERSFASMVEKIQSSTARLQESLREKERLLLQIRDFNLQLEQRVKEVTASLEAAHQELLRQERLAAIGQLTAGIAHEIRNPLLIIKGSAEMLQKRVKGQEDLLQDIREEADRVNRIVSELLEYARPLALESKPILLHELLDRAWARVQRVVKAADKEVEFQNRIAPTFQVEGDPSLLEQAFLNLLLNAWQAISREGEISAEARWAEDGLFQLAIRDDGDGISAEDLPQVFLPFFSKRRGGIGLGLPMVQKIVEAHRGKIAIHSSKGRGTTVILTLPAPKQQTRGGELNS